MTHIYTHTHTPLVRTPLDQGSARHRALFLKIRYTLKRQKTMPSAGFELAIPTSERPETYALECAATEI